MNNQEATPVFNLPIEYILACVLKHGGLFDHTLWKPIKRPCIFVETVNNGNLIICYQLASNTNKRVGNRSSNNSGGKHVTCSNMAVWSNTVSFTATFLLSPSYKSASSLGITSSKIEKDSGHSFFKNDSGQYFVHCLSFQTEVQH